MRANFTVSPTTSKSTALSQTYQLTQPQTDQCLAACRMRIQREKKKLNENKHLQED
jgi:hypothetical protein